MFLAVTNMAISEKSTRIAPFTNIAGKTKTKYNYFAKKRTIQYRLLKLNVDTPWRCDILNYIEAMIYNPTAYV